jgi:hypothetical protein
LKNLQLLVPGLYADGLYANGKRRIHVDMAEFLSAHSLPDAPELRAAIWSEIQDIFAEVEMIEISADRKCVHRD